MKFTHSRDQRLPKVAAAASKDESRPVLGCVHLDAEVEELQATNSYIAVRVPVEVEKGDVSGLIDRRLIEETTKRCSKSRYPSSIPTLKIGKKTHKLVDPIDGDLEMKPPKDGQFPNLKQLWPTQEQIDNGFKVGFNPDFLKALLQAIDALPTSRNVPVQLIFPAFTEPRVPHALRPMIVRTENYGRGDDTPEGGVKVAEALLMPIRLPDGVPSGEEGVMEEKPETKSTRSTKSTTSTKSTKSTTSKETNMRLTKAQKATIPYADVPDDQLTAGQKAAKTKGLKAAGLLPTNGNGNSNGKAKKPDLAKTLKTAVKTAKTGSEKKPSAKANGNGSNGKTVKLTKAQKADIPYFGIPDDQLGAGQKAARTKALKAAGLLATAA